MPRLSPGQLAPDFTLPDVTGQPVSLSDYAGQAVYLKLNRGLT